MDEHGNGEKAGEIREDGAVWDDLDDTWKNEKAANAFLEQLRNTPNDFTEEENARFSEIFRATVLFIQIEGVEGGGRMYTEDDSVFLRAANWNGLEAARLRTRYEEALYPEIGYDQPEKLLLEIYPNFFNLG